MPLVLFDADSAFHSRWAAQFVQADKLNRKSVGISGSLGPEQVRDAIVLACRQVTGDHEIIFAVGHGGATDMSEGTVDLAPNKKFRLSRGNKPGVYLDPFYDFVFPHDGVVPMSDKRFDENQAAHEPAWSAAHTRLKHWQVYASIGTAMRANHIYKVTFLTCRIGNAIDFIKKISIDWGVLVKAYRRFVIYTLINGQRSRAFLEGDAPGSGTNVPFGEENIPQTDFVTVGPPLAQPVVRPVSSSSSSTRR
jgi:hypothetical protein